MKKLLIIVLSALLTMTCATFPVGKLNVGMTETTIIQMVGRPDNVNVTVVGNRRHEQWVYRATEVYLYFENGYLKSWQY